MSKDTKERILTAALEMLTHIFAYVAPISALTYVCDRKAEKTENALRNIEAFSRHFIAACGVK